MDTWKEVLKLRFSGEQFMASRRPLPKNFKWQSTRAMTLAFFTEQVLFLPVLNKNVEKSLMEKNSQELSPKCSLLFLLSPPRHCTQSEIRIYCHFADDSRGSDLLSQKNNESSAQSTVKHGLWVALFPCLPIYLRTVKSIMSINAYKLAGRRWVDISNQEQVPDVFSEINSILTLLPFSVLFSWWRPTSLATSSNVFQVLYEHGGKFNNEHRDFNSHSASNTFSLYAPWVLFRQLIGSRCFCWKFHFSGSDILMWWLFE